MAHNENICECFVVLIEFALQNNILRQQNNHLYKTSWQKSSVILPVSLPLWFFFSDSRLQTPDSRLFLPIHPLPVSPPDRNRYPTDLHFFRGVRVNLAKGNNIGTVDAFELGWR